MSDVLKAGSSTETNIKTTLKQPVYKRQRFLLAFIQHLPDNVSVTDLQKLVFLYSMQVKSDYYSFIPYRFGAYSFQLAQDVEVLEECGYLSVVGQKICPTLNYSSSSAVDTQAVDTLRGNSLIRKAYNEYPYYAINSEIAERLMSQPALQKIQKVHDELTQVKQVLFTIGYEGKTVENFVNMLIGNDVTVLCDVRKSPISRKFGFSQSKLKHIVETIGIKYIHIPELGIESEKRNELQTSNDYDSLFTDYRKTLLVRQNELQYVYNILIAHNRIALMCYEQDPRFCHRKQVENYIVEHYEVESEDL
ncbi:MAG: DUF488 domain-containing protein [Eubacteriales bacterium]|nr:DUF488 domain-containing protein [Eubacteriales bacterium]